MADEGTGQDGRAVGEDCWRFYRRSLSVEFDAPDSFFGRGTEGDNVGRIRWIHAPLFKLSLLAHLECEMCKQLRLLPQHIHTVGL